MKQFLATTTEQPSVYLIGDGVSTQSIPNETWTTVTLFKSSSGGLNTDPNNLPWRAATPSRLYNTEPGSMAQVWEVAFAFDGTATGVRGIRTRAYNTQFNTTITAEGPIFVPGIANPTGNDAATGQHLQIFNWGPDGVIGDYTEVQVYQNSGGALNLISDVLAAPQCMAWYTAY